MTKDKLLRIINDNDNNDNNNNDNNNNNNNNKDRKSHFKSNKEELKKSIHKPTKNLFKSEIKQIIISKSKKLFMR